MEAPAWWAFPPSFTLQPVADTRAKQVAAWGDFVVGHCRWAAPPPPSPLSADRAPDRGADSAAGPEGRS